MFCFVYLLKVILKEIVALKMMQENQLGKLN
ncbi:hypothetical protein BSG1_13971 [Bacillus sp. SG-1]|nr:hypothetical protein BSG1_13971 [Bacillus sp. SG-1]